MVKALISCARTIHKQVDACAQVAVGAMLGMVVGYIVGVPWL